MTLRDRVTKLAHRVMCANSPGRPEDGCCGCGAPTADVYVTVGCPQCGAPGEPYCWPCIDTWPDDAEPITLADLTVYPGHHR